MHRFRIISLLSIAVIGMATYPCNAWHSRGHMAVALIAYRQLDQAQKQKVQEILANHPDFAELLSAGKPQDASKEEWIVMQAAIWPDWVRSHSAGGFSKPLHHYQDLPVKQLDGASDSEKADIETNIAAIPSQPANGQLFQELPKRIQEVRTASTEAKQRAVALCWVLHLIGDIHQPLHAASLFTKDSPKGDHGGNSAFVPWNGHPENLHSIWDGVIGWDEFVGIGVSEFGVVDLMARDFQHRYPITDSDRAVSDVEKWGAESRDLAEKDVYSFNGSPIPLVLNFDRHPHLVVSSMTPLSEAYRKNAIGVAEKRVTLAGFRLADRLKDMLE